MAKGGPTFQPQLVKREDCRQSAIDVLEGLYLATKGKPAELSYIYWFLSDKSDMVAHYTNGDSIALGPRQ